MTKTYNICLLPGDGIGPEIIAEGVKVLDAVGAKYDTAFSCTEALLGGCAIDACGTALPDETLRAAEASDAVLLAAVGGPKWDTTDPAKPRPEQGLLGIRKALGLYTNLRPVQIFNALADASTLKPEIVDGVDMMIVRELTGGLYFGRRERFYDEDGCGTSGAAGQRFGQPAARGKGALPCAPGVRSRAQAPQQGDERRQSERAGNQPHVARDRAPRGRPGVSRRGTRGPARGQHGHAAHQPPGRL